MVLLQAFRKRPATAVILAGALVACDNKAPGSPSGPPGSPVLRVTINGPDSVAPGQSAQFTAIEHLSNGTNRAVSTVQWSGSGPIFQVNVASGLLIGQRAGEGRLTARVTGDNGGRTATKDVLVLPAGTFRMVGMVTDAGGPIEDARVEAAGGAFAITDRAGQYRAYGVPAAGDVVVTRDGYRAHEQSLRLTAHTTQNFQLTLSDTVADLAGSYTITIEARDGCARHSRPLPPELQQRTYSASLTQVGSRVDVTLTESRFHTNSIGRGNRFSGRAGTVGATFTLEDYLFYYNYGPENLPDVVERLDDGRYMVVYGKAELRSSSGEFSGTMAGTMSLYAAGFPRYVDYLGSCGTGRFTLTRR